MQDAEWRIDQIPIYTCSNVWPEHTSYLRAVKLFLEPSRIQITVLSKAKLFTNVFSRCNMRYGVHWYTYHKWNVCVCVCNQNQKKLPKALKT